ncbi:MAG: DNA primase [bacterium]|nr:DNA primase [bacterium]
MAPFDQDLIDQILAQVDIQELISAVVPLTKRSGDNAFGLCPFHAEKTPSFSVNRKKQIFHCFGCGKGGNAIAWLMAYEHISFPEAVRRLAEKVGIPLPRYKPSIDDSQAELLYRIHQFAQEFYYSTLRQKTPHATIAMRYLLKRGLSPQTIDDCGIGLSPTHWDSFAIQALKEGFNDEQLILSGLCGKNERGELYDRFRNRIMFPIQNLTGRIVGFGGRILPSEDDTAKYLNSPETPIFRKGDLLYGMSWARDEIRKENTTIVVEGYFDLITLHQSGIRNVVATSGTALTRKQALLLKRFSPRVILVYDGDDAGRRAALRGGDVLIAEGLDVKIAFLPESYDPDTYVNAYGADEFKKLMVQSMNWLDYQFQHAKERGMLDSPATSIQLVRDVMQVIRQIQDTTQQELWIRLLTQKVGLSLDTVRKEIEKITTPKQSSDYETHPNDLVSINHTQSAYLLSFFIRHREYKHFASNYRFIFKFIKKEHLDHPQLSELYDKIHQYWIETGNLPSIEELRQFASSLGLIQWVDDRLVQPLVEKGMEPNLLSECICLDNAVRKILRPVVKNYIQLINQRIEEYMQRQYDVESYKKLIEEKKMWIQFEKKLKSTILKIVESPDGYESR